MATTAERETGLKRIRLNFAALSAIENDDLRGRLVKLFYPNGLEEFTDAPLDGLDPLFDAYLDLLDDVSDKDLPDGFAARTTTDLNVFEGGRGQQIGQQAVTTRARLQRQTMVPEVTGLLTDNYHFLCLHFRTERNLVASFFNPRHLETGTPSDAEATNPPAPTGN